MVAKLAFTPTNEDWLFLRILRRRVYNTGIVCYIFFPFALLPFLSSFSEDLTVVRIVEIEKFSKHSDISSSRGFLYNSVAWRFLLMYFFFKVSANFLILILAVIFFIVSVSRVYYLGFVLSLVSWLLDSILCAFSELF